MPDMRELLLLHTHIQHSVMAKSAGMLTFSARLLQFIPQLGHLFYVCIMQALHRPLLLQACQGLLATSRPHKASVLAWLRCDIVYYASCSTS